MQCQAPNHHFVPAKPGEVHVLLVPSYNQSKIIRLQLAELQRVYGGEMSLPLHLSCQRFHATQEELKHFKHLLSELAAATPPLQVVGTRLEPFYSTFHAHETLKWHIELGDPLAGFFKELTGLLKSMSLPPLLKEPPALVTLLTGIFLSRLEMLSYRRTLFVGERLVLSQLTASGRHLALFSAPLSYVPQPTRPAVQRPLPY